MSGNIFGTQTPFSKMPRPNKPKSERLTDPVTLAATNGQPALSADDARARLYPDRAPKPVVPSLPKGSGRK